jgi:Cd2+/Zn2+-exporting ATPase
MSNPGIERPDGDHPGPPRAPARREFGGWRDRGWHELDLAHAPPPPIVAIHVPLVGMDEPGRAAAARAAIARLQPAQAALSIEDGELVARVASGAEAPIDEAAEALGLIGIGLDTHRARVRDARVVHVTVSAPPAPPAGAGRIGPLRTAARAARAHPDLALAIAGGVALAAGLAVHLSGGPQPARLALLALSAVLTSTRTFPEAIGELRGVRVNIDVLMFAAAAGAAVLGHYEEGAFLLFLFGLGAAGEHLALSRARSAINALAAVAPDTALVIEGDAPGSPVPTPVERVAVGASALVRPFARVPLDGEVVSGRSAIDESTITGEPIPVDKGPGDTVFAGTMNTDAALRIRVTKRSSESTLARVLELVAEAQEGRSRAQLLTDRVERWYVPFVFVATAGVLVVSAVAFGVPWARSFYNSMAFMTAASPCALAIGTPAAVLCAVGRAARFGVLFKGGAHLDTLARTRAIAYDKTGTLTTGAPRVVEVIPADGLDEDGVLALAAAVEAEVTHPLAEAIVREADARSIARRHAAHATQIAGVGARGEVDGRVVEVVKPSRMPPARWPAALADAAAPLAAEGHSLVVVTRDGEAAGLIALADTLRPGAAGTVARLRALGIERQIMLTGDHGATARSIARAAGLDEVHAELLPERKLELVRDLVERHGAAAMVGDGVNDAPALAAASIGVAMGAAGADVAMETADVALMGASLENLPRAVRLARAARAVIRQNVLIALGVIALVAPLGALGMASLGVAVLLHEGSTIVVVLNALRLLRFDRGDDDGG